MPIEMMPTIEITNAPQADPSKFFDFPPDIRNNISWGVTKQPCSGTAGWSVAKTYADIKTWKKKYYYYSYTAMP